MIETSGLADPAPIIQALALDPALQGRVTLARIVTTIDAVTGPQTLANHPEARKQAAFADTLVLTKTDLAAPQPAEAAARGYNAAATLIHADRGRLDPAHLLPPLAPSQALAEALARATDAAAEHTEGLTTVTLVREQPVPAIALTLFLEALAEACGPDLLRIKGLVAIAEAPETPAVVQGVQHVFHALDWLEAWPSADRRTRLVFIGRHLMPGWPRLLLAQIEREVAATA